MGRVAILLVISLVLVTSILSTSLFHSQSESLDALNAVRQKQTAKRIASEFAHRAIITLEDDWDWRDGFSATKIFGINNSSVNVSVSSHNSGSIFKPTEYTIKSVSKLPSSNNKTIVCTTNVVIIKQNFAQYGLFSGNNQVAGTFWDGEIIDGPFHTNGKLTVGGNNTGPDFYGPTTSVNGIDYNRLSHDEVFHNTTNFKAEYIPMPNNMGISALTLDIAYDASKYPYIELNPNGTATLSKHPFYSIEYQNGDDEVTVNISDILNKNNGILYSTKDIYLKGTLSGQLTIATSKSIHAVDDILLADDPRKNAESTDLLGLMSEDSFYIRTDKGRNLDGILIMANIYTEDSIEIEDYRKIGKRGYFEVYGGRVQYKLSYTLNESTSRYYEYKTKKVKDKYKNEYEYVDLSRNGRRERRKSWRQTYYYDYEFEEKKILRSNNRYYTYPVITKKVKIYLNDISGFREKFTYDTRLHYINPPGYPVTGKAQKLSIYEHISYE